MSNPSLLIIVLNYRTADMTLRAASAALADMPLQNAEMVIVDNASGDGSEAVLRQAITDRGWDGRVRFVTATRNGGFGAGNNIGIRYGMSDGSEPDFVYVVNSDAFADRGAISALLAHLQTHPKAGIAGSHLRGTDDVPHRTAFRFPSIASEFEGAARIGVISRLMPGCVVARPIPQQLTKVDWVAGASVMLRGEMLQQIGLFDEGYFLYFEETDLCLRAARSGWECWYVPESRVVHIGSVSTGMKNWRRMPTYWFDSRRRYFTKNHGRIYAGAALAAHLTGGLLHRLRCVLSGREPRDAPGFLRDLAGHSFGLRRRSACPHIQGAPSEDTP